MASEPLTTEWMKKALKNEPVGPMRPRWMSWLMWRTFVRSDGCLAARRRRGFGFVGTLWNLYLRVWWHFHPGEPLEGGPAPEWMQHYASDLLRERMGASDANA